MHGWMHGFQEENITNAVTNTDWWTSVTNADYNQMLLKTILS